MRNTTPFLPGISPQLYGSQRRSQQDQLRDRIERLRRNSLSRLCELFGRWLPLDLFEPTAGGANSRERSFPLSLTFWAFLSQVLNPGSPCREIVRKVQAWYAQHKRTMPEGGSGAYCQARKRMPLETLRSAHQKLAAKLMASPGHSGPWKGHRIQVVDGTGTASVPAPQDARSPSVQHAQVTQSGRDGP